MAKQSKPTEHYGKWRIRWTDEHGQRQSLVFDKFKDAEYVQRKKQSEVEDVKRGLRSPTPSNKRFAELCDYWLENRTPLKRSPRDDFSLINSHLRPTFGDLNLKDLSVEHVDEYIKSRKHLSHKTISNHLTHLIAMLNLAVDMEWLTKAPRIRKPKTRMFSSDYRFLRTKEEIDRFLTAALLEGQHVHALYTSAVFTGMREGELSMLLRSDVDFDKRLIAVQRSFNGPTKAGDMRWVPILDPLLPVLREWMLRCPGPIVFPNLRNKHHGPSARIFQETLRRVLDRAGFPKQARKGKEHHHIVFHDLRHTFASHWMMNGGDLFKLQKILGHKSVQMTLRYAHLSPHAFTDDFARLGSAHQTATIIPLRESKNPAR